MKNNQSFILILATIIIVSFQACKKDRTTVYVNNPGNNNGIAASKYASLSAFFKSLSPSNQVFKVSASTSGSVIGKRGMKFIIPANAFRDNMNNPVTGTVTIILTEVVNYRDMMGSGARTEAYDGILGSAAMFNITATQNGQPVYLASGQTIKAEIPINKDLQVTNLQIFQGNPVVTIDTSLNQNKKDTTVKWFTDSSGNKFNADSFKQVYDSLLKLYELKRIIKFNIYMFGWCNLDKYYNSFTGCKIRAQASGVKDLINMEAYMKLNTDGYKGLYKLTYEDGPDEFTSTYYNLPPGWNIQIIILAKDKNGKVYKEDRVIVNANTLHEFKNMAEISDADLESFFNGL